MEINPEALQEPFEDALRALRDADAVTRLWARDHTLWSSSPDEISNRLGWLDSPEVSRATLSQIEAFAAEVRTEGITDIVVLGMGGSSLGPDAITRLLSASGPVLHALDTTSPGEIRALEATIVPATTLFVVASKSGSTVETRSQLEYFWNKYPNPGQFVAITDSGSTLEGLARQRNLHHVFLNPADIGGRYAAFSLFGLVPAAGAGVEIPALLDSAARAAEACQDPDPSTNPAARLAALLAAGATTGRDKLTILATDSTAPLAEWIEQLTAESLGKHGKGIVPVLREPADSPALDASDRLVITLGDAAPDLDSTLTGTPAKRLAVKDAAAEMFRWQTAIALTGHLLGINPFDQPDVEAAKQAARQSLSGEAAPLPDTDVRAVVTGTGPTDYLAILAYLPRNAANQSALDAAAASLRAITGRSVTTAFGPRYLHSTGQLHKGGPPTGRFLVILPGPGDDLPIPGEPHTFGQLQRAQATGDIAALAGHSRPVAVTTLEELAALKG